MVNSIMEYFRYKRKMREYAEEVNRWNAKVNRYNHWGFWSGE